MWYTVDVASGWLRGWRLNLLDGACLRRRRRRRRGG
jgi:hypothetical protein